MQSGILAVAAPEGHKGFPKAGTIFCRLIVDTAMSLQGGQGEPLKFPQPQRNARDQFAVARSVPAAYE